MHPILIEFPEWLPLLGGRAIHTYGLMVALGFFVAMLWVKKESKRVELPVQAMMDLFFYCIVAAIVGSRILYVLISVPSWWKDPLVFFRFWEGGLVFYGGMILTVLTVVYYTRKKQMPYFKVADVLIPGLAIGHAIGRLGCFAAGCCHGKEAGDSIFAVVFPEHPDSVAITGVPLYPTQLFEAFGEMTLFAFLVFLSYRKKFHGEVFLLYIILYPILRSILEIFRGDQIRGFLIEGVLSTSQFISLIWVTVAMVLWLGFLRKKNS